MAGGADRDRTDDLLNANQALSQLSYSPRTSLSQPTRRMGFPFVQSASKRELTRRGQLDVRVSRTMPANVTTKNNRVNKEATMWNRTTVIYSSPLALCRPVRFHVRLPRAGFSITLSTSSFRKEVIQPQVLLRLPCYDFTPIMSHTLGRGLLCRLAHRLLVQPTFVM